MTESPTAICPRCFTVDLEERREEVDGAPWAGWFSHQCPACGMGMVITASEWRNPTIANMSDLLAAVHCETQGQLDGWVTDFTDGHAWLGPGVTDGVEGLVVYGGGVGTSFDFPDGLQRFIADLEYCEEVSRASWEHFTSDAARRLVPLTEVDGIYATDPAMPEGWACDDDGEWRPPVDQE